MSQRVLLIAACVVLMAGNGASAYAQGAQSTQPTQATVTTQNGAQNSTANPSSGNSATPQPTQKKVWTNDELSAEDPNAGISTVGKATNNTAKRAVAARPTSANGRNAKWYQDQITKLQAKIPVFDGQIADLQAALDGKVPGDGKRSVRPYGVKMDDWSRELIELQQKRGDTLDQISALRDQARHNGVAPNAIP
jgi:Tfp pilus assembly protein PilV